MKCVAGEVEGGHLCIGDLDAPGILSCVDLGAPQVDLVRRGWAVPVAHSLANRSSRPSAPAQCAEAETRPVSIISGAAFQVLPRSLERWQRIERLVL